MKRTLLYLFALLLSVTAVDAQVLKSGGATGLKAQSPFSPKTRAYGEEVFTYAQNVDAVTVMGAGDALTSYDCAIFIPATYAGKSVSEIAFYIVDATTVENVKCWVADKLPDDVDNDCAFVNQVTKINSSLTTNGYPVDVKLDEPYTVPEGGCYVGYSLSATSKGSYGYGYYPVATDGQKDVDGGMWLRMPDGSGWQNCYGTGFGNLLTMVMITGEYPDNAAIVGETFPNVFSLEGGTFPANLTLTNRGSNAITSIGYVVKDVATGETSEEATIDTGESLPLGYSMTVAVPLEIGGDVASFTKEITVTKVNGQPNEATGNTTSTGTMAILPRKVDRKVVEEEFTATGCGYCTRGIAGMEALSDKYPDNYIGIAVHGSVNYQDPMQITDYDDVLGTVSGFPSAYLNRVNSVDPYFGTSQSKLLGIVDDVATLIDKAPEAAVEVQPVWNADSTVISVNTNVSFLFDSPLAPYALAYVLVADGLHGSTSGWIQTNYYAGSRGAENEPYLYKWTKQSQYIAAADMEYEHVAIAAQGVGSGLEGSIAAPIVEDAVQTHSTEFDVSKGVMSKSGENLIQDKSKLKVVAMLINTQTGEIVNADEKTVMKEGMTGISNAAVSGDGVTEVARYTIDGTKVTTPVKGVNVIKMSDGTTRKVVVK